MHLTKAFYDQFEAAAGAACLFELRARLLAELHRVDVAHARQFSTVIAAVREEYANELSPSDDQLLERGLNLRNKIVHSDFRDAHGILEQIHPGRPTGGVQHIDLQTGDMQPVAATESTEEGRVFGWLLELGMSEAFVQARAVLLKATQLIDRLVLVENQRIAERAAK